MRTPAGASTCANTVDNCQFTVRSGNLYFVSGSGNDTTGNGSFSTPWKTLYKARSVVAAGGTVYAMTGSDQLCTESNRNVAFEVGNDRGKTGTASNPIAFVVYPEHTVQIGTADPAGDGCASNQQNVRFGVYVNNGFNYWTISGFTIRNKGLDGAFHVNSANWRIIGNDIAALKSSAPDGALFLANSFYYVYGNNIHDSGLNASTRSKLFHQIYIQANHVWIGWNSIHDNYNARAIQVHKDNAAPFYDIHIHHNQIYNDPSDAINFSNVDPSQGTVEVYNNLIWRTGTNSPNQGPTTFSGIYAGACTVPACSSVGSGAIEVYNNTFYDVGRHSFSTGDNGVINIGSNTAITVNLRNNIVHVLSGEKYLCSTAGGYCTTGTKLTNQITGDKNNWYCTGTCPTIPSQTTNNVSGDPLFVSTAALDFHLQGGSPAIDAGLTIAAASPDFDGVARPQGTVFDLGAYEFVPPIPDIGVTKTHIGNAQGNFRQGDVGRTYTITVYNVGTAPTTGLVTVVDTLPAGLPQPLTATAISGTGWICGLGPPLTCTRNDALASGSSTSGYPSYPTITLTVDVAPGAAALVTNTVTVSGGGEVNTSNNTAPDPTIIDPPADLTVAKTHSGNFAQGQTGVTYTITVSNNGPGGGGPTVGTVTLTDTLPTGLTATAMSGTGWTCNLGPPPTCTRSDVLLAGASYPAITLTVNVAANAAALVTNMATVSGGGELNATNNTASDVTTINPPPDLTVTKTHSGDFHQGQTGATYSITVNNIGLGPTYTTVTLIDTLPSGLTATAISGNGWTTCVLATRTCTRSDVLLGSASYPAITLTVNVAANAAASVTNMATVSGGGQLNTANDTGSDVTTVNPPPDLTVTKTHSGNFNQGQTGATYTITVNNAGGTATSGTVTVVDALPTGLTATGLSGSGWTTCVLVTLTCTRSTALAAGASYPAITLTVNVAPDAPASVNNTATASGGGEVNTANNTASDVTTITPPPDLTVTKTHSGNFVQGGIGATYTITVNNAGSAPTSGTVTMVDTLPTGLTATALSGSGWTCVFLATRTCTRSTVLAASASYPAITLTVNVAANAPASVTNMVTVSGGGELNAANSTASDVTTVGAPNLNPDLTVTKTHSGSFSVGQIGATYTITVSNSGTQPTAGTVTMVDTLPAGLTATAISGTGWTCPSPPPLPNPVSCTRSDPLIGGTNYPAITLTVNVAANAAASVINMVTVSGGGETNTSNNTTSDVTTINQPDLTVTKTHTGNFNAGQVGATYTISVRNVGTLPTSGTVTVVDTLPTGLTATAISGTGWTCPSPPLPNPASCTRSDPLIGGTNYPAITLTVNVAIDAASSVTNTVTVSGGGEANTSNNTASDVTTVNPPADLTVTKTHFGSFTQGQTGAFYTITVRNSGGTPTSGTVTMTDTLPTGLTATAISGTGWTTCVLATLTCTRSDALAAGVSYAAIILTVNVAANAAASVTNTVTVSGGGEVNIANNTAADLTAISPPTTQKPDLTITKTHSGNFTAGQTSATYAISVSNVGNGATVGVVGVTDLLPGDLTATAIGGAGWNCVLGTLNCTRSDPLAAGTSYPDITITVDVAANAPTSVTNTATVSGGSETNTANNTASDVTTIGSSQVPDLTVSKTHSGDFTAGQTGALYTITVNNVGNAATSGTVTATDAMPTGLTATGLSGTGWTCVLVTLTCTRGDALAAGASYPAITLTVNVAANAPASVTNTVTVSGGGQTNTANDTASDLTNITGSGPVVGLSSDILQFGFSSGETTQLRTVEVQNLGGSTLRWMAVVTTDSGGNWIAVTPTTGVAPSTLTVTVNIAGLAPGSHTGRITISEIVNASGSNSVQTLQAAPKILQVQVAIGNPLINNNGIVNNASWSTEAVNAPGGIASLFGVNLAPGTAVATTLPLPVTLLNTQVLVDGTLAPLFGVTPFQIDFQMPYEVSGAIVAQVVVVRSGVHSSATPVPLAPAVPGIYSVLGTGSGPGVIQNEDRTLNAASNPAAAGSVITIYATGMGVVTPALASGYPGQSEPKLNRTVLTPSVLIGGTSAELLFSGVSPGYVGLYQINVRIPPGMAPGSAVSLQIMVGAKSNIVTIAVK